MFRDSGGGSQVPVLGVYGGKGLLLAVLTVGRSITACDSITAYATLFLCHLDRYCTTTHQHCLRSRRRCHRSPAATAAPPKTLATAHPVAAAAATAAPTRCSISTTSITTTSSPPLCSTSACHSRSMSSNRGRSLGLHLHVITSEFGSLVLACFAIPPQARLCYGSSWAWHVDTGRFEFAGSFHQHAFLTPVRAQ